MTLSTEHMQATPAGRTGMSCAMSATVILFWSPTTRPTSDSSTPALLGSNRNRDNRYETRPKAIVEEHCTVCTSVHVEYDLYKSLFATDPRHLESYASIAPLCYLNAILIEHLLLRPSKSRVSPNRKQTNLTTNWHCHGALIMRCSQWPGSATRDEQDRLIRYHFPLEIIHQAYGSTSGSHSACVTSRIFGRARSGRVLRDRSALGEPFRADDRGRPTKASPEA